MNKLLQLLARLEVIPRKTIYLVLFIAAGLPFLYPIRLPLMIWKETRSAFNITQNSAPNKVVAICSNWDPGSQGENWPQYEAIVAHCMMNHVPFIVFSIDSDAVSPQLAETVNERQAKRYGCVYGRDWVNLGLTRGAPLVMGSIGRNIKQVFQTDYRHNSTRDFTKLPLMEHVNSLNDFSCLWDVEYTPNLDWTAFFDPASRVPLLFSCAGMVSSGYYPYISSGQIIGMMVGTRGAAEYENLLNEKYGKAFKSEGMRGQKLVVPLAFGHLVIIFFILAGNVGMIARRKLIANERAAKKGQL